ncbi:MAG TPA: S8 family serine peptidase [Candidatus Acidoferrales bacterium]|nr:S8 family serine peptidase [Candidatus Acidoferrales bacterium]
MHRNRLISALVILALAAPLCACGGGGGGGSTVPAASNSAATASPGATPGPYTCPSSDSELAGAASGGNATASVTRRAVRVASSSTSTSLVAVSYRSSAIANPSSAIDARVASLGAIKVNAFAYPKTGVATRLLHVAPGTIASVETALRAVPGVIAVGASHRFSPLVVNSVYLGNDPYFVGASPAPTPLYETSTTGGQWDMHVVQLEHAFGYSQQNNASGDTYSANALGSTSVKLAIIDTGEDVTHPELAKADIVRTRCFITNEDGTAQSTGDYVTDGDGHGTDVTGIAEANPLNGYGFVGDAGNVALMLYRIFPTPDDNCKPGDAAGDNDPQCGAADVDVASAIDDAVANGANVINMSLGGTSGSSSTGCPTPGVDFDTVEGDAIANAIANDVIVVAASGNNGGEGVDAPACDSGVIAVGATGYNDGEMNGSNYNGSNAEYVTSYTQYGTTSWGIVAPGGDPYDSGNDADYLHWIENIWTTTPFMSSATDTSFTGTCTAGAFSEAGNCRTLIAGTSMATPHVAGAAALILSVNPSYATPAMMFSLLCSTADDIGDAHQGCGRLNVYRAMAKALGDPDPPM